MVLVVHLDIKGNTIKKTLYTGSEFEQIFLLEVNYPTRLAPLDHVAESS